MHSVIDDMIFHLKEDVLCRRVDGVNWLEIQEDLVASKSTEPSDAAVFFGYLSQWVDIACGDPGAVKNWIQRLPHTDVSSLRLADYLHVRLAAGTVAFSEGRIDHAAQHFDFIIGLADEMAASRELIALGHFWKARCEEALGAFTSALAHLQRGRALMVELRHPRMAASMGIMESRLFLELEKLTESIALLEKEEAVINEIGDPSLIAEVASVYGRIALRQGRYEQALKYFCTSTGLSRKIHPQHGNLARCLVNLARAKRLLALRLARRIDAVVDARRKSPARQPVLLSHGNTDLRRMFEQLQQEAFSDLGEAEGIYQINGADSGIGLVRMVRALLFLDDGDLENADREAAEAYQIGFKNNNSHLMANARLLQSWIESGKYEEGLVGQEEPIFHVQRAYDYVKEALVLAEKGNHRRLIARAHISQGLMLCNDFFNNSEAARECCDRASGYFTPDHRDYVWEEFQVLRAWVQRGSLAAHLGISSHGSIDGKSLQQMTAEFEEAIIPRVWELEERKISRAAARLSISPKKVRRVLNRLRLDSLPQNRPEPVLGPRLRRQRQLRAVRSAV